MLRKTFQFNHDNRRWIQSKIGCSDAHLEDFEYRLSIELSILETMQSTQWTKTQKKILLDPILKQLQNTVDHLNRFDEVNSPLQQISQTLDFGLTTFSKQRKMTIASLESLSKQLIIYDESPSSTKARKVSHQYSGLVACMVRFLSLAGKKTGPNSVVLKQLIERTFENIGIFDKPFEQILAIAFKSEWLKTIGKFPESIIDSEKPLSDNERPFASTLFIKKLPIFSSKVYSIHKEFPAGMSDYVCKSRHTWTKTNGKNICKR